MIYLGCEPVSLIARLKKAQIWRDVGRLLKTAKPTTSRDAWSSTIAIH